MATQLNLFEAGPLFGNQPAAAILPLLALMPRSHDEQWAEQQERATRPATPAPDPAPPSPEHDERSERARAADLDRQQWEAFRAKVEAAGPPETLIIGDPARRKPHYQIDLLQMDDGWHFRREYSYRTGGGTSPYNQKGHESRADALGCALVDLLTMLARPDLDYPPTWEKWAIDLAPPPLEVGLDLVAYYNRLKATYAQRWELRATALRTAHEAGEPMPDYYTDERGGQRNIYSL